MLLIYIIKEIILSKKAKKPIFFTGFYKGFHLYFSTEKREKKGFVKMLWEADRLARFWHCFPDTYFRFGMFMKGFGDMELMRSFIPQHAYSRYAADKEPQYHILVDDKILFHNIMMMYGIPVPERFFVYQRGLYYRNGRVISDAEVDEILNDITDSRLFIKRFRGGAASGISLAVRENGTLFSEYGWPLSAEMIRHHFGNDSYIFEKQLEQDLALANLNPDTVNTCRVLTYKNKVISCNIRVGRKGSYVDNAAKGGIVLSLDMDTGKIEEYGLREYDLTKYYVHPDTNVVFKDYEVPQWPSIKSLVEKTINLLPYYNSVGFDVATTVNGPVIIEINTGTGVYVSQMGKKVGIADKFITGN